MPTGEAHRGDDRLSTPQRAVGVPRGHAPWWRLEFDGRSCTAGKSVLHGDQPRGGGGRRGRVLSVTGGLPVTTSCTLRRRRERIAVAGGRGGRCGRVWLRPRGGCARLHESASPHAGRRAPARRQRAGRVPDRVDKARQLGRQRVVLRCVGCVTLKNRSNICFFSAVDVGPRLLGELEGQFAGEQCPPEPELRHFSLMQVGREATGGRTRPEWIGRTSDRRGWPSGRRCSRWRTSAGPARSPRCRRRGTPRTPARRPVADRDERQREIDVVDHQVEDGADVHRSKRVGAESLGPDVFRRTARGGDLLKRRIEPLDVPDLQRDLLPGGEADEQLAVLNLTGASGFSTRTGIVRCRKSAATGRCRDVGTTMLAASMRPNSVR